MRAFAVALSLAAASSVQLPLDHAVGVDSPFSHRETVVVEQNAGRWRGISSGAVKLTTGSTTSGDDLYRVRLSDSFSSVRMCVLADAGFKHDIAITLNAANAVQGVEVRPHVPVGYSGCKSPAAPVTLPSELKASRVIVITPEEAAPIPVIPGGKGVPFPGQPELSDAEVLALSSEGLDAEGKAALEAQMRSQGLAGKTGEKAEPSFFQKYWHFLLLGYVLLQMSKGGGGASEGQGQAPATRGAGAPAAAAPAGGS